MRVNSPFLWVNCELIQHICSCNFAIVQYWYFTTDGSTEGLKIFLIKKLCNEIYQHARSSLYCATCKLLGTTPHLCTNHRQKKTRWNFTSVIYFILTPLGQITSEEQQEHFQHCLTYWLPSLEALQASYPYQDTTKQMQYPALPLQRH